MTTAIKSSLNHLLQTAYTPIVGIAGKAALDCSGYTEVFNKCVNNLIPSSFPLIPGVNAEAVLEGTQTLNAENLEQAQDDYVRQWTFLWNQSIQMLPSWFLPLGCTMTIWAGSHQLFSKYVPSKLSVITSLAFSVVAYTQGAKHLFGVETDWEEYNPLIAAGVISNLFVATLLAGYNYARTSSAKAKQL